MTSYTWLLFDADGTLFDYDQAERCALARTFQQIGYPFEPQYLEAYRDINTQLWLDFERGQITQEKLKTRRFEHLLDAIHIAANPQEVSA